MTLAVILGAGSRELDDWRSGAWMIDGWRTLRVGDRIRMVRFPTEWEQPGYHVPLCTRRLYRALIDRRRSVRVYEIKWGMPWIRCRLPRRGGGWEHHFLAIIDDSWVRVRSRE